MRAIASLALVLFGCGEETILPLRDATVNADSSLDAAVTTCAVTQSYQWSTQGGALYTITPAHMLTVTSANPPDGVAATCSLELPACLSELSGALAHPDVGTAFAQESVFVQNDSTLRIERADGKRILLGGGPCDGGIAGLCAPDITPPLTNLRSSLRKTEQFAELALVCRDLFRTPDDPGRPSIGYGPKADAHLFVDDAEVGYVFFTAVAAPPGAHLFADPARGSMFVDSYYLSLVLDDAPWKVGTYDAALRGRARFALSDGRSYEGDAASLRVKLTVTESGVGDLGEAYLRASAQLIVPSTQGGAPLRVELKINS